MKGNERSKVLGSEKVEVGLVVRFGGYSEGEARGESFSFRVPTGKGQVLSASGNYTVTPR